MTVRRTLAIALSSSVVLAGIVAVTATSASGAPPTNVQPRTTTYPTVLAIVKTIPVGADPQRVAVNNVDDTVYVTNNNDSTITVINGRTGTPDDTITVGNGPLGIAVNQEDDTVYVVLNGDDSLVALDGRTLVSSSSVKGLPTSGFTDPGDVAIDQTDDSIYVSDGFNNRLFVFKASPLAPATNANSRGMSESAGVAVNNSDDTVYTAQGTTQNTVSVVSGRDFFGFSSSVSGAKDPYGVAVNQRDDTVYVANRGIGAGTQSLWAINGRTNVVDDTVDLSYGVSSQPNLVAVDQTDDTVYVTSYATPGKALSVLNARNLDDSVVLDSGGVGASTSGVAVDDTGGLISGLVYTVSSARVLLVVGQVTPTSWGPTTGSAGTQVTIGVDAPQVPYELGDNAIRSVKFGSTAGTSLTGVTSDDSWTVLAPSGVSGTVPVTVVFNGGQEVSLGTFTFTGSPTPTPVYPPDAPTDVVASAGVEEASVSWKAPAYVGSFPITDYQVTSSPGSKSCLVKAPALSCTVTGLTAGTSYTFTARALNGAGWGVYSSPSNAVTPTAPVRPSILITGSRDASDPGRIRAEGTSTGLVGERVTPYVRFPGQPSPSEGTGVQTVAADGTFAWGRKTGKKTYVFFQHGTTRSNTVVIPAR